LCAGGFLKKKRNEQAPPSEAQPEKYIWVTLGHAFDPAHSFVE
jgi:hypothetical protein